MKDELAENAIPDPGYIVGYDIVEHDYDDLYNYEDDAEYGDDAYWDTSGPRPAPIRRDHASHAAEMVKSGSKRKRDSHNAPRSKRQKTSAPVDRDSQPVIYLSREVRMASYQKSPPAVQSRDSSFALLPDWREKFRDTDGLIASKRMPKSMARAVYEDQLEEQGMDDEDEGEEGVEGEEEGEVGEEDDDEGEGEWESEEDDVEGDIDIDPDHLRTILVQKLAEAGISGDEEASFLQSINEMLSGEGKGEAAADLLEKAQAGDGRKRKADSAVGLEPAKKRGKSGD